MGRFISSVYTMHYIARITVWFLVLMSTESFFSYGNEIQLVETDGTTTTPNPIITSNPSPVSSLFTAALVNITRLEEALQSHSSITITKLRILEELGDTYSRIHYYNESIRIRQQFLHDKQKLIIKHQKQNKKSSSSSSSPSSPTSSTIDIGANNVMSLVKQYVSLAQDYKDTILYDKAIDALHTAQEILNDNPSGSTTYPALLPLLYRMEATMLDCKGEDVNALGKFTRAKKIALQQDKNYRIPLADTLQHLRLLKKIISLPPTEKGKVPVPIYQGIEKEYERQVSSLLSSGPWIHPQQLPKVFIPGLTSLPWHHWSTHHWPHLETVASILRNAHNELVMDFRALKTNDHLDKETECIHDAYSGGWRFHMLNGYWVPKDANGCSLYAPHACALLQRIEKLSLPNFQVVRGGFSVIDKQAHLKPHFGLTNAQLKFHIGLIVPQFANGTACAHLRVGNETRVWREKEILFFDDSYEHEVWNHCETERAVFQLVFAHPDLTVAQRETIFSKALRESH